MSETSQNVSPLKRELLISGLILVCTLVILLPVTYLVGVKTFGEYQGGGSLWRFVGSIFSELSTGNLAIWFFMFSPLLAISIARFGWFAYKRL